MTSALDVIIHTYGKGTFDIHDDDIKCSYVAGYGVPRCKKIYWLTIGEVPDIVNYTEPINNILDILRQ